MKRALDVLAVGLQSWALASYFGPPLRVAALSLACLGCGVGCAAIDKALGGGDDAPPQHDLIQGGTLENGSGGGGPLFARRALDAGAAAIDRASADEAAAQGVVDAVGGTSP